MHEGEECMKERNVRRGEKINIRRRGMKEGRK